MEEENVNEEIKRKLPDMAKYIVSQLPEGYGFSLLVFPFGEDGGQKELMYISNANRDDMVKAMNEFVMKTKYQFGNDTGKY